MRLRSPTRFLVAALVVATATACQQADSSPETGTESASSPEAGLVEVTARDFEFEIPSEIPSGWTTFLLENAGEQEHFLYVYRLPDDVTFDRFLAEAMAPFGRVWNRYASGEIERAEAEARLGSEIPGWFFTELTPAGGPALTEAGETSRTTVMLEPGTYVVECYVKTPQGTYHTERGMQKELTVTEASNGASPPSADVELTLSNYAVDAPDELEAGPHTIAVHVAEDPEGFNKHDVNLVRLDGDATVEEVVAWMDWMNLDQFRAPGPGHSLGGVDQMVAGRTGYMTVDLEPGRYVWVSEGYGARGVVKEFTVP